MEEPKTYQARKKEGLCVRPGCKRKPSENGKGKRRSYCAYHNEQNRKNSEAWLARQKKTSKPKKAKRMGKKPAASAPAEKVRAVAERALPMPSLLPSTPDRKTMGMREVVRKARNEYMLLDPKERDPWAKKCLSILATTFGQPSQRVDPTAIPEGFITRRPVTMIGAAA